MHQAVIVSAMLVSGLALFGSVAWIQTDRAAWTSVPETEVIPVRATISSLREAPPVVLEDPNHATVELPPVEIVGRRPAAMPAAPQVELVSEPCSAWEEIGPSRVIDGIPVGARHVRQLCPRLLEIVEQPEPEAAGALAAAQY
jgi:hypothetical protein